MPFNPNIYHEVFEKSNEIQVDVVKSHYLFEIQKFNQSQTKQPVDSKNESEFGKKLSNYLDKKPINSNIYGEHLDDEYITKGRILTLWLSLIMGIIFTLKLRVKKQ